MSACDKLVLYMALENIQIIVHFGGLLTASDNVQKHRKYLHEFVSFLAGRDNALQSWSPHPGYSVIRVSGIARASGFLSR